MTHLDDRLRELFTDDRLDLVARAAAVRDVVRGAHRRRTRRIVATSFGALGVAAAVALGSFAVVDVVGSPEPPVVVEPVMPTPTPTPPPSPSPSSTPDPGTSPSDDAPVFDPVDGFGGVHIGMTIDELEQVDGVSVEEYSLVGRTEYCYGRFESDEVYGLISVRSPRGEVLEPAASEADYVVTLLAPKVPAWTPEGIGPGSTTEEVRAAYPGAEITPVASTVDVPGLPGSRWFFNGLIGDAPVRSISLDGGQLCAG